MPIWRLQTTWQLDSTFPRDRMCITPHFDDGGISTDPDGLCEDLATALQTWVASTGELTVKAYDAQGSTPVYPQGSAVRNAGASMNTACPRELALCLSFYSGQNVGRKRGRVYLPMGLVTSGSVGLRPSPTHISKVDDLAVVFQDLGGPDVDWCVYSRADDVARPVTNWFVDDEWDIQRRRGLRSSSRSAGTTSEA